MDVIFLSSSLDLEGLLWKVGSCLDSYFVSVSRQYPRTYITVSSEIIKKIYEFMNLTCLREETSGRTS